MSATRLSRCWLLGTLLVHRRTMSIGEDTSATAGYWEGGYGLHVLPLALGGGGGCVVLSGGVLSVASMILVHHAVRDRDPQRTHDDRSPPSPRGREGVRDTTVVVQRAAMEQLSPIPMTTLVAGLALIPLALG